MCDTNTAAILVPETPYTIKHDEFERFLMMIYDVSEASNEETFEAR